MYIKIEYNSIDKLTCKTLKEGLDVHIKALNQKLMHRNRTSSQNKHIGIMAYLMR